MPGRILAAVLSLGFLAIIAGLWLTWAENERAGYREQWREVVDVEHETRIVFDDAIVAIHKHTPEAGTWQTTVLDASSGEFVRELLPPRDFDQIESVGMLDDGRLLLTTVSDAPGWGMILWRSSSDGWDEIARRDLGPTFHTLHLRHGDGRVLVGEDQTPPPNTAPEAKAWARALVLDASGEPVGESVTLWYGRPWSSLLIGDEIVALGERYNDSDAISSTAMITRVELDGTTRWQQPVAMNTRWDPSMLWGSPKYVPEARIVSFEGLLCARKRYRDRLVCVVAADGTPVWELEDSGLAIGSDGTNLLVVDEGPRSTLEVARYSAGGELRERVPVFAPRHADAYPRLHALGFGLDGSLFANGWDETERFYRFAPAGE